MTRSRSGPFRCLTVAVVAAAGCARVAAPGSSSDSAPAEPHDRPHEVRAGDGGAAGPATAPTATQLEPDGNDDEEAVGAGTIPVAARWERVGTPPLALTRICDLTPFGGALYAAHAHQPLGTDGATITRYRPDDEKRPFSVAFDWNRPGEPTKGGGAGQGFVRVRAIGGRLFVPDADPPYGGLGLVDGAEGYVFVSSDRGAFAPPRMPKFMPPGAPELRADAGARAGAGILPRAYHVLDVIRFRGALYASTGSVPPKERAWRGPSPGALHRASADGARWTYEVDYPYPWKDGVWRLTFMTRFKDRLYAGIQDYDGRDPHDFVVFTPPAADGGATLTREDAHPTRVTRSGASGTLRWYADTRARPPRLYWLAWTREGIVLRVTIDGDRWARIALPDDAGRPADVTRFRDGIVVLTERGLYRLDGPAVEGPWEVPDGDAADAGARLVARVDDGASSDGGPNPKRKPSPFEVSDFFCTAPLAVLGDRLYAGGQRGGTLYRLAE